MQYFIMLYQRFYEIVGAFLKQERQPFRHFVPPPLTQGRHYTRKCGCEIVGAIHESPEYETQIIKQIQKIYII